MVLLNSSLFKVPLVARMPITCVFECIAAGFMAGSIPMKGTSYFDLNSLIALVVAVLHATTMSLQFMLSRKSVFFILNRIISSLDFSP
ncbi:hypothetical protein D3C84_1163530 [compost metagenome]